MDKLEELLKSIQQKIEQLLKPLLEKLPLKKRDDDFEDEEDDDDSTAITEVLQSDDEELDEEDGDDDDDDSPIKLSKEERIKKIKELAPKAILGLVLVYLVLDQFIFTKDQPPAEKAPTTEKQVQAKVKSNDKKRPEPKPEPETKKEVEAPVVEKIPEVTPPPAADVPPETSIELVEKKKEKKEDEPEKALNENDLVKEEKFIFENLEPVAEKEAEPMEKSPEKVQAKEESDLGEKLEEIVSNIEPGKVDDVVGYVAPPSYQRFGRGLIYNCLGKHWACVDQYSYIKCRENNKYNLDHQKKPECVIKNVYATDDDCVKVQKYYVDNNEPTTFCSISNP